jgi:transglutaminase-like putative cysteine protease
MSGDGRMGGAGDGPVTGSHRERHPEGHPGRPARPDPALSGAVGAASVVGAIALCTIVGGFPGSRSVVPILVTAVVGAGVTAVLLRTRRSSATGAAIGAAAVLISATATTVPGATWFGIPTLTTYRVLHHDAAAAKASLQTPGIPYHAVPGVVLVAAVAAGMLALVAQLLLVSEHLTRARPSDRRLVALLPSFGLIVWASAVGSVRGATLLTSGYVAVAIVELALTGRSGNAGASRSRSRAPGRRVALLSPVVLLAAVVVAAVVVAGVAVSQTEASAGGATGTGGAGSNGPTSELRLLSSVVALERRNPSTVVFTARSPMATYWEVGALTVYRDGNWEPSPGLAGNADGRTSPTGAHSQLPSRTSVDFPVRVTVDHLAGRLVPLPPDTVTIDAPFGVVRTAGGAVALRDLAGGDRYEATATVPRPLNGSSPLSGTGPGPGVGLSSAQRAAATALPALPASIRTLASRVAAGAGNPLTAAVLLENWFRSGAFHYSLAPTPLPRGTAGLLDFLTTTRTGTCEQFAGAFAVLARSIGLPTRVMVGFTTGLGSPSGVTTVRGADAHAWPEVYLGATAGWVSFEPTPGRPSGETTPADVVGPTRITPPTTPPPSATPTTVPTTRPTGSTVPSSVPTTTPTTVAPTVPTSAPVSATTSPSRTRGVGPGAPTGTSLTTGSGGWLAIVLAVIVAVAVVGSALFVVWRRRRRRADRRSLPSTAYPAGPLGAAWRSIDRSMDEAGAPRSPSTSPVTYGRGLADAVARSAGAAVISSPAVATDRSDLSGTGESGWSGTGQSGVSPATFDRTEALVADVAMVAELLERSVFGDASIEASAVADAVAAARRVHQASQLPDVRRLLQEVVGAAGATPMLA